MTTNPETWAGTLTFDLEAIKLRRLQAQIRTGDPGYPAALVSSAADVPALVAEVERQTARLVAIEGVHIEGCWRNCGKFPCSCECHQSRVCTSSTERES